MVMAGRGWERRSWSGHREEGLEDSLHRWLIDSESRPAQAYSLGRTRRTTTGECTPWCEHDVRAGVRVALAPIRPSKRP